MTSAEYAEHKKGESLFNCLKIISLFKIKLFLVIFLFQTAKILDETRFKIDHSVICNIIAIE